MTERLNVASMCLNIVLLFLCGLSLMMYHRVDRQCEDALQVARDAVKVANRWESLYVREENK